MILWLLLLVTVLWPIIFKYRRRRFYKVAATIAGSGDELPLLGLAHKFLGSSEAILGRMKKYSYTAMERHRNGIINGWLGPSLYYLAVNPVDLELVLKTCLDKGNIYHIFWSTIGYCSIFAPVSIWRRRRKMLASAFSTKILENYVEVFSKHSEKLVARLDSKVNTGPFSLWSFISTYALDCVCETTMGVEINAQDNHRAPFLRALKRTLELILVRTLHIWLHPEWLYRFSPQHKELHGYIAHMYNFINEIITKKRDELKTEPGNASDNSYDLGAYQRMTFLELSLSDGERRYNDVELREEMLLLAGAGSDTVSCAIGFTLKLLAKYPKIQEKVYQELLDVFDDSDRPLMKEDLTNLKYLERVVKESLRLFPPVPFILRDIPEDTTLPSGRVLAGGSKMIISIWGMHLNPQYWGPTAEHFDPDRFLPERYNLPHPCCYMPFSVGSRNCLGYQYAHFVIKTGLSAILRRYKVVGEEEAGPSPHIRVKYKFMMKAIDGYQVGLERRQLQPLYNKYRDK